MKLVILVCMLVPAFALAQPSGSAGSGSADPAPPAPPPPLPDKPDAAITKTCTDAMNADPAFALKIVAIADEAAAKKRLQADLEQHEIAAAAVAKNQKHVILAYAAMWIIAAAFVMFLWRRQQLLRGEIAQLKADLDAATKEGK